MNRGCFYFWDNGSIYTNDRPYLVTVPDVPLKITPPSPDGHPIGRVLDYHEFRLLPVAEAFDAPGTDQRYLVLMTKETNKLPIRPIIRYPKILGQAWENRLIEAAMDIVVKEEEEKS